MIKESRLVVDITADVHYMLPPESTMDEIIRQQQRHAVQAMANELLPEFRAKLLERLQFQSNEHLP